MDILPVPTASQKFAELLRSAASSCPEYAVWAAILESPLSDGARSEIESLLSEAFEEGMESLTGDRMAGIMSRLAEILERERQELVADRRDAESLLLRFFATSA
jgi:hypothetical protein